MTMRSSALAAALAVGALALARLVAPALTFNLWDNFETFTPQALFAHSGWLGGHLPLLNTRQSLGVSPLGIGDNGVLYFPYTVLLWFSHWFGAAQSFPEWIGTFHVTLAFAGWFTFARAMRIREPRALLFAAGVAGHGYFLIGTALWHFIGVSYAWMPWILVGTRGVLNSGSGSSLLIFVTSWTACAWGSHAQQLTYVGLHVGLMALVFAWPLRRRRTTLVRLAVLAPVMAALALPAFVYGFAVRAVTERASEVSADDFFAYAFKSWTLRGLVSPALPIGEGYLGCSLGFLIFGGSWIVLGVALVGFVKNRARVIGLALIALLFLDFAFGRHGLIYSWTRSIPVWSSFRFVFKFAPHVTISLAILAVLGLESGWPRLNARWRWSLLAVFAALPVLGSNVPTSLRAFAGVHAALLIAVLGPRHALRSPWVVRSFALLYLSGALWVTSDLSLHRYSERYGEFGSAYFKIEATDRYRLAPLTDLRCSGSCAMQARSLFDAATVNDYLSLSGHQMGMSARALTAEVSPSAWGFVPPAFAARAIGSPLYRALAVRYYLVSESRLEELAPIFAGRGLRERSRGDGWRVIEDPFAREIVHVPEVVVDDISPELHPSWRTFGATPVTRARGLGQTRRPRATSIGATWWIPGRGLGFDVTNGSDEPSFALASLFPWSFLEVEMDGNAVPWFVSNAVFVGVNVPPGSHRFEIYASGRPLARALALAVLCLIAGAFVIRRTARARP